MARERSGPQNYLTAHRQIPSEAIANHLSAGEKARPIAITCETVNICNNACIICAYPKQTRKRHAMPMNVFEKVAADYSAIGGGLMSLTPMVGEVFLDKLLVKRLRLLDNYPKINSITATTNAVMVTNFDDHELQYIMGRFAKIHISIYGIDEEEYRRMTLKNTYQKMIEGIRTILRYASGEVVLGFRFLKSRDSQSIEDWLDKNIRAHTNREFGVGTAFNTYSNWGMFDTTTPLPFDATWVTPAAGEKTQCIIPLLALQVLANGDVSFCACSDFDGAPDLRLGSIMESSLLDLYNSERVKKLWRWDTHGVPPFCQRCTFHQPMARLEEWPWFFERPLELMGG